MLRIGDIRLIWATHLDLYTRKGVLQPLKQIMVGCMNESVKLRQTQRDGLLSFRLRPQSADGAGYDDMVEEV